MMNQIALIGMIVAMIGVVAVLGTGLVTMARGKDMTGEKTNKLMWWRVYLQAIALAFFALVMFLAKK
ncbi:MAG: Hypoxia induced protein conserved region [Alphaproteobacteria bacterium]|nr:Hypoxia induced protein conserved region [Alphaproteobacteria bacterium]